MVRVSAVLLTVDRVDTSVLVTAVSIEDKFSSIVVVVAAAVLSFVEGMFVLLIVDTTVSVVLLSADGVAGID